MKIEAPISDSTNSNPGHLIVSRDEWLSLRKDLLLQEKELTHARDRINAKRRELPWVRVDKDYVFDTPEGKRSLADLFGGRSQLVIYHFMFGSDWQGGWPSCSFVFHPICAAPSHLAARDST